MTRTRSSLLHAAVAACLLSNQPCFADETGRVVTCPQRLPSGIASAQSPGDGWVAEVLLPAWLTSMGVFRGPIAGRGQIMPITESKTSTEEVDKYHFAGSADDDQVWVQCTYGGGVLSLSHPITGHPRVCVAHYVWERKELLEFAETRCQ
jgi:hypothetical protein